MTTHAETAAATRDALGALWLPPASVVALVEATDQVGCLDEAGRQWLRRVCVAQRERIERQKRVAQAIAEAMK